MCCCLVNRLQYFDYAGNVFEKEPLINFSVLVFLAIPEPITTLPQAVSACVGDTVFLPSSFLVSPIADDVKVAWFTVVGSIVPADNGIVIADYSYEVDNVIISDAGQYFARVTVLNQGVTVQGPAVSL